MKRQVYDRVSRWKKKYPHKTMEEAFEACRVSAGTYYNQKRVVEKTAVEVSPTYERVALVAEPVESAGTPSVKPGMVAFMGAPEDVARMLAALAAAGGRVDA